VLRRLARLAAPFAALGRRGEPALRVKLLLGLFEEEGLAALAARDLLVAHGSSSLSGGHGPTGADGGSKAGDERARRCGLLEGSSERAMRGRARKASDARTFFLVLTWLPRASRARPSGAAGGCGLD